MDILPLSWVPLHWVQAIVGHAVGTWLGSGTSQWHCTCAGNTDLALIEVLKLQLDRCGPEHLIREPQK